MLACFKDVLFLSQSKKHYFCRSLVRLSERIFWPPPPPLLEMLNERTNEALRPVMKEETNKFNQATLEQTSSE